MPVVTRNAILLEKSHLSPVEKFNSRSSNIFIRCNFLKQVQFFSRTEDSAYLALGRYISMVTQNLETQREERFVGEFLTRFAIIVLQIHRLKNPHSLHVFHARISPRIFKFPQNTFLQIAGFQQFQPCQNLFSPLILFAVRSNRVQAALIHL